MTVIDHNLNVLTAGGRLVLGNWKMHGSAASNRALISDLLAARHELKPHVHLGVCAPFPYLAQLSELLAESPISWGAQDISAHEEGAYTGEVSATMLRDFDCRWVLVGHSERREMHGESSELVAIKAKQALQHGLTPVVCVGESLIEHEAGQTLEVIRQQLAPILELGAEQVSQMVIAYEPIWAIGSGLTATPEQAQEVHAFIRSLLDDLGAAGVYILYGGSVKPDNAASLFAMQDINGALVGGASLAAEDFLAIAVVG